MTYLNERQTTLLIVATYVLLTLAFVVRNPLFEAPDEYFHYFTVLHVAETNTLPAIVGEPDEFMGQEAAQPPLYYVLGSLLIRPIDTTNAKDQLWLNPRVQMGDASSPTNINRVVTTDEWRFPWQGPALAAIVLRLFSMTLGAGTLIALHQTLRLLWPRHVGRRMMTLALIACLPQFTFLHSYINNDTAIILFASWTVYQLVAVWLGVDGERVSLGRLVTIGILVGLAILSKTTGLLLLIYAVGFLAICRLLCGRPFKEIVRAVAIVTAVALLVAGWLYVRNWNLYGDITAANQFVAKAGGDRGYTLGQVFAERTGLWLSLFGVFGWFNIVLPRMVYAIWGVFGTLAAAGMIWAVYRMTWGMRLLSGLLLGWVVAVLAGMLLFLLRTPAAQGRLLFPAIIPLALGLGLGLSVWIERFPKRSQLLLRIVVALFFASVSAASSFVVIPRVFAGPQLIESLPDSADVLNFTFENGIELVAADLPNDRFAPGEIVWIDLFWRTEQPPAEASEIVIEIFGRERQSIGKLQTFHGGGLLPDSEWAVGDLLHSRVGVKLYQFANVPTEAVINILVIDDLNVDAGKIKVSRADFAQSNWEGSPVAQIGDGIELVSAEITAYEILIDGVSIPFDPESSLYPGMQIVIDAQWYVQSAPNQPLTTLVHLGAPDQPPLAQGDSMPLAGDYPTVWWEAGELIDDQYKIQLPNTIPAGTYPVRIGMYDASIVPLLLTQFETDGTISTPPHRSYTVGEVSVTSVDK